MPISAARWKIVSTPCAQLAHEEGVSDVAESDLQGGMSDALEKPLRRRRVVRVEDKDVRAGSE